MAKAKQITQPTENDERQLNSVMDDGVDYVMVRGKRWAVRWIRNRAKRKVTDIFLNEKEEDKVAAKCTAALRLNGYFKIKFFYWILWRWYYYVRQYSEAELLPFIEMCKKKVQLTEYFVAIILLTEMKDTMMMMTRAEAEHIRQGSNGAQHGTQVKNTNA